LVMMGASVGSSLVTLILSLEMINISPLIILSGWLLSKSSSPRYSKIGKLVIGIGILLSGMVLIKTGMAPVLQRPELKDMLVRASQNPLTLTFTAFLLTSITQSSPMVMALAIALTISGITDLPSIVWIVIGSHLGNSVIVLISGMGKRVNARRLAWGNFLFRLSGSLIFIPLSPFTVSWISTIDLPLPNLVAFIHMGIALFNVLLFLPFTSFFAISLEKMIKPGEREQISEPLFLSDEVKQFPSMALNLLAKEMVRAGNNLEEIIYRIFQTSPDTERIQELSEGTEKLLGQCVNFLSDISAPASRDFWKREYSSISYSLAALRDMADIMKNRLYPLLHNSRGELREHFEDNQNYSNMTEILEHLVSTAVGSFALGGTDLALRAEKNLKEYLEAESKLRGYLMERGLWLTSGEDICLWDLLSFCNILAQAAFELARSNLFDQKYTFFGEK
ncbi:MAG: Na/Pi cotransporter family protein, partial [Synergistales bacterium]|nr:Na/Pi cotransporter family protein [Synergistales bacterium]